MSKSFQFLFVLASLNTISSAQTITETFGSGANAFTIDFVTIGNPGNAADTRYARSEGSVSYLYNVGKYEISRDQINKANLAGGVGIALADLSSYGGNLLDRPATGVNWYEAAKFVNFLNSSQNKQVAYNFDASGNLQLWGAGQYSGGNRYRHKEAYYFLPSRDEWYKAAYSDSSGIWYDYPTASNSAPVAVTGGTISNTAVYGGQIGPANVSEAGGVGAWGTIGQGGNAYEWSETSDNGLNNDPLADRNLNGGNWQLTDWMEAVYKNGAMPGVDRLTDGLRVASVPEPSSLSLLALGGVLVALGRRKRA